jgi:hypothetical protein
MLSFLGGILEAIENFPTYVLAGVETLLNLFFEAIQVAVDAAVALLPSLPEIGPPAFLESINWFFPIGALLPLFTSVMTGYVVFLGVRWIFSKVGEL